MNYDIIVNLVDKSTRGMRSISGNLDKLKQRADRARASIGKIGKFGAVAARGIAKLAAAATAAAGAIFALTVRNANLIGQTSRQASVIGTTVGELQKWSFAAESVNIEQDKLVDIMRDVNDRVGDFLSTGAGPMADFFEKIAPKVGVTADEFRNLSGPQALQLYVDSLEAANLSGAEMTFYLEAMASDLTDLMPLLTNGGEGFENLAQQAEDLGLILDDASTNKITSFEKSWRTLKRVLTAVGDQITAGLSPGLQAVSEWLIEIATKNMPDMQKYSALAFQTVISSIGEVWDGMNLFVNAIRLGFNTIQAVAYGVGNVFAAVFRIVEEVVNFIIRDINKLKTAINDLTNFEIRNPFNDEVLFAAQGTQFEPTAETTVGSDLQSSIAAGMDQTAKDYKEIFDNFGSILSGEGAGREWADGINAVTDAISENIEVETLLTDVRKALGFETEEADDKGKKLKQTLLDTGGAARTGLTEAQEAMKKLQEEIARAAAALAKDNQDTFNRMNDTLGQAIGKSLASGKLMFEDFRSAALNALQEIIMFWVRNSSIFQAVGGGMNGGGSLVGGIVQGIFGMFAGGGSIPAGGTGIVGENGAELVKGPATVYSNTNTRNMRSQSSDGSPVVFNTTLQVTGSETQDPAAAKRFADQFNSMVEAKVSSTIAKMQNGRGMQATGTSY